MFNTQNVTQGRLDTPAVDSKATDYFTWLFNAVLNDSQGQPTSVVFSDDDQTVTLTKEDIINAISEAYHLNVFDPDLMRNMATLINQVTSLKGDYAVKHFDQCLLHQTLQDVNMPLPSSTIIYTATTDLMPTLSTVFGHKPQDMSFDDYASTSPRAKDTIHELVASFSGYLVNKNISDKTLLIFVDNNDYKRLESNLKQASASLKDDDLIDAIRFLDVVKDPSSIESVALRGETDRGLNVIGHLILDNLKDNPTTVASLMQGMRPQTITLINIDKATGLTPVDWDKWAMNLKRHVERLNNETMSFKNISRLESADDSESAKRNRSSKWAASDKTMKRKAKKARPMKGRLTPSQLAKWLMVVMKRHKATGRSDILHKVPKRSFQRANRRQPDDPNLPGIVKRDIYDIMLHVFVDTSGSISESQYRAAVLLLLYTAKKLGYGFIFSSFSHVVSQPYTFKNVRGKSVHQLYRELQRIPKVTGGTNFKAVHAQIDELAKANKRKGNTQNINVIISDFEYSYPSSTTQLKHLNRTYYIPVDGSSYVLQMLTAYNRQISTISGKDWRSHFAAR